MVDLIIRLWFWRFIYCVQMKIVKQLKSVKQVKINFFYNSYYNIAKVIYLEAAQSIFHLKI